MNYFDARQDSATKRWHYTVRNGRYVDAVGMCGEDGGHDTAKEACACFRAYTIEHANYSAGALARLECEFPGCEEVTKQLAIVGARHLVLCEDHCNAESLEQMLPEVGSSIES